MRRPDSNRVPLLVLQHAARSGRELCISYEFEPGELVCNATPVQGPLAVGDLNGSAAGVPPDEIVTSKGGEKTEIFGFAPQFPLSWSDSTCTRPAILWVRRVSSRPRWDRLNPGAEAGHGLPDEPVHLAVIVEAGRRAGRRAEGHADPRHGARAWPKGGGELPQEVHDRGGR
jgi:hypothetical protein